MSIRDEVQQFRYSRVPPPDTLLSPTLAAAYLIRKLPICYGSPKSYKLMLTDREYCYWVLEDTRPKQSFNEYGRARWRLAYNSLVRYWLEKEKRDGGIIALPLV